MIELLAVQAITTVALAIFVIKLRRELYPMVAAAGQPYASFWVRSTDVLVLTAPQFEVIKTVLRVRWLLTEELFLIHRLRAYDVAMRPISRSFYKGWRAWLSGNDRYRCVVDKPRLLARLYTKAIEVVCYDMENERSRKLWEAIEIFSADRRRRKRKA